MTQPEIERIVKSTVHIVMSDKKLMPVGIGSGCIIDYQNKEILLTVAHVTDVDAATCIVTEKDPVNYQSLIYSVGAMNYLATFDMSKYELQLAQLKLKHERNEEVDFGQIDFSFATLKHKADFLQKQINFNEFTIPKGEKLLIKTTLAEVPVKDKEYGFFGRVKALYLRGTPNADTFETQEVVYGGMKFIRKVGNYYEFELPNVINDHADFQGTSGAPIMDGDGKLVSLITHGYTGGKLIYGIALADFKSGVDAVLLSDAQAQTAK
jgi:hypothetical protein